MSIRDLSRRLSALDTKQGGVKVWTIRDGEDICISPDGERVHVDNLPDDGTFHILVRRFGENGGDNGNA